MKKITILFFIIFAAATDSFSQTATVTGKITNADSGAPIDLASVFIRTENLLTETDGSGKYSFEVPAGVPFELG